jgi:hypothetical protein
MTRATSALRPVADAAAVDDLTRYATSTTAQWIAGGLIVTTALGLALRAIRRPRTTGANHGGLARDASAVGRRWLIGLAVAAAVGVAGLGGVRSFEAVSVTFGSPLVPLTADGMIIACTALRLAALTRGWRLPGSVVTTYGFIAGTVWLNVAAAHGWTDAVAHALAPVSYAVLVEFLAHFLRLHLRLAQPSRPRVTALTWVTSPVVTTRVWLHMARAGEPDPVAARALVQQVIRMSSRLATICPSKPPLGWLPFLVPVLFPFDRARAARVAALQTIRDGLLTAADLAALLPEASTHLDAGALLALVDRAALQCTTPTLSGRTGDRTSDGRDHRTGAPDEYRTGAPDEHRTGAPGLVRTTTTPDPPSVPPSVAAAAGRAGRDERTDDELVSVLHRHAAAHNDGQPLSQREVMRVLGVGTPKAKRLAVLAGWVHPASSTTGPSGPATTGRPTPSGETPEQVPGQLTLVARGNDADSLNAEHDHARNSQ